MSQESPRRRTIRPSVENYESSAFFAEGKQQHRNHHHHKNKRHGYQDQLHDWDDDGGDEGPFPPAPKRAMWSPRKRIQTAALGFTGGNVGSDSEESPSSSSSSSSSDEDEDEADGGNGGTKSWRKLPARLTFADQTGRFFGIGSGSAAQANKSPRSTTDGKQRVHRKSVWQRLSIKDTIKSLIPKRTKIKFKVMEKTEQPFFVGKHFIYEEDADLFSAGNETNRYYFKLNILQRIFVTLEHPNSCRLAIVMNWTITIVTLLSVFIYIIGTLPEVNKQPSTCDAPVCENDPTLCPSTTVCPPEPPSSFARVEFGCLVIFVVDYFSRVILSLFVPPRLTGNNNNVKNKKEQGADDSEDTAPPIPGVASDATRDGQLMTRDDTLTTVIERNVEATEHNSPSAYHDSSPVSSDNEEKEIFRDSPITPQGSFKDTNKYIMTKESDDTASSTASSNHHHGDGPVILTTNLQGSFRGYDRMGHLKVNSAGLVLAHHSKLKLVHRALKNTFKYCLHGMNVVDVIAIIPFFLFISASGGNAGTLSIVRVLRLARILRVLKLGKGSKGVQILLATMVASSPALLILGFFSLIGVILLGAMEYFFEGGHYKVTTDYPNGAFMVQDVSGETEVRSKFLSIPMSMYWSIITSTAVGFGDIVPTTYMGRFVAVVAMYGGILVLALPISVIGNNFERIYDQSKGHLSYGVVNSILELMEDDTEENEKELNDFAYGRNLLASSVSDTKSVYESRKSLLEKRAAKLASVFVISQVCLKESEAEDINILLTKVGLLDIICALEYAYDLEFRRTQLQDFVIDACLGFTADDSNQGTPQSQASSTKYVDVNDMGASNSTKKTATTQLKISSGVNGMPLGANTDLDHFKESLTSELHNKKKKPIYITRDGTMTNEVNKRKKRASSVALRSPEFDADDLVEEAAVKITRRCMQNGPGGKVMGRRLSIGDYQYGPQDKGIIQWETIERDEATFYKAEFEELSQRTQELIRYLRRSPEFMETGVLRKLADKVKSGQISPGELLSMDCEARDRLKSEDDRQHRIFVAKKRVNNAMRRVEMAMHAVELQRKMTSAERDRLGRLSGSGSPMVAANHVPFAGQNSQNFPSMVDRRPKTRLDELASSPTNSSNATSSYIDAYAEYEIGVDDHNDEGLPNHAGDCSSDASSIMSRQ